MEKLTIKQLKEVCTQKGITFTSKDKKTDLVDKLKGSQPKAQVGRSFPGEF